MFVRKNLLYLSLCLLVSACESLPSHNYQKLSAQDLAQGEQEVKAIEQAKKAQLSASAITSSSADIATSSNLFQFDPQREGCFNSSHQSGYNEQGIQECSLLEDTTSSNDSAGLTGAGTSTGNTASSDYTQNVENYESASLRGSLISLKREGLDFRSADLRNAEFLPDSSLKSANLSGADLQGAKLGTASFEKADFADACLVGTNFRHANVLGANFKGALYSASTKLPFAQDIALKNGMILATGEDVKMGACAKANTSLSPSNESTHVSSNSNNAEPAGDSNTSN